MIRQGDFTLLEFFEDGRLELYNVADDLGQQKNLAAALPEKTKQMQEKLAAWRTEIGAPMPKRK